MYLCPPALRSCGPEFISLPYAPHNILGGAAFQKLAAPCWRFPQHARSPKNSEAGNLQGHCDPTLRGVVTRLSPHRYFARFACICAESLSLGAAQCFLRGDREQASGSLFRKVLASSSLTYRAIPLCGWYHDDFVEAAETGLRVGHVELCLHWAP